MNYFKSNTIKQELTSSGKFSIEVNEDKLILQNIDANGNKLVCEISKNSHIANVTAFYSGTFFGDITLNATPDMRYNDSLEFYKDGIPFKDDSKVRDGKNIVKWVLLRQKICEIYRDMIHTLRDNLRKSGFGITLEDLGINPKI